MFSLSHEPCYREPVSEIEHPDRDGNGQPHDISNPHAYDHRHANVSSGWLRASVFGAMDGLVSNIGLIAGIAAAGAPAGIVIVTGISGLLAGGISMALGEYTSVRTQNEQLDAEVRTERSAHRRNPRGEQAELGVLFEGLGMDPDTAKRAASQIHADDDRALRVHLAHELNLSPEDRPSPWVAAISSMLSFSVGAVIPVLPYLLGIGTLPLALAFGGAGLALAGGFAARFTKRNWIVGGLRQLLFGGIAVAVTYGIGMLFNVSEFG